MQSRVPLNAEMFSDEAVYRRTTLGQRELLRSGGTLSTPGLRVLTRVNGFTDLRSLVELAPADVGAIAQAIRELVSQNLIELVHSAGH
jgi:hypothetical protein